MMSAQRLGIALVFGLLVGLAPAPSAAADVEGRVHLPEKKPAPARPRARYPGAPAPAEASPRGPAVVFLDGVPFAAAAPVSGASPSISQRGRQFEPLALPVLVGTAVEFPNEDAEHHNVFSRSSAKELELGRYGKGHSRSVTFDKPGLVRLRCEIHGWMHAVILVLENPYFAVADQEGRYHIEDVPPGEYRIYAFHEDHEPSDKPADPMRAVGKSVRVPETGSVTVDFDLEGS
jgi:plastocyanin